MPRYKQQDVEESIYDLIPKPARKVVKPPMHRSKFPHDLAPTASTFGAAGASQIGSTNLSGDFQDIKRNHNHKNAGAHYGKSVHVSDPTAFRKKNTGLATRSLDKKQPGKFKYKQTGSPKPPVVTAKEAKKATDEFIARAKHAKKDYVTQNALAAITSEAKKTNNEEIRYTQKAGYGKRPAYLDRVQNELASETQYIREVLEAEQNEVRSHQPQLRQLPEEERLMLLHDLKIKWASVNKKYQLGAHVTRLDTIGKIRRKEQHEEELKNLETSIEKLSRSPVFVQDGPLY